MSGRSRRGSRGSPARETELLTVEEAAEWLRLTPMQVRGLVGSGRLAAVRVTREVLRVERSELLRFIHENRTR